MIDYTLDQCKNKFKYLKAKYVKVKNSMSDRNTGGKKITFDYFDEFEEMFGKDSNIEPVAIASCSGLYKKQAPDEQKKNTHAHQFETATAESTPKKQKSSPVHKKKVKKNIIRK
ncbi:unnamed protein product [Ceutorhynchus assimilis]|uniref:Myb/SANT-like DNA-binding domain-containing protein n=1 Tax=Ceutorhynchus assimilis TaxID=467358 RepID=A0A9N9MN10_9CUCU|nr:unnamed protein product [Ceutorhynchus assimilis]